jgi:putative ABC transport system permease protein
VNDLIQDFRYALRQLRKSKGFTAVAVITLALGIGANAAIFSLVNGILLVSLPYPNPAELVSVTGTTPSTYPKGAFVAMRQQIHTMDVATYAEGHEFNLTHFGEPVRLTGTAVSAELLSILGAQPELGRTFHPGEDAAGADNYVILSHALWEERFGHDAAIVGRSVELEGVSREVVGVMPADFHFPSPRTQLWVPLQNDPRNVSTYWAGDYMPVIGRLRPGSTIQQATAEIRLFQSHVPALFPWRMPPDWNAGVSVVALQSGMVADVRVRLLLLLGAVALVLLIACANVANLMLSRAASREKEMAIRSALGAGKRRIARQVLTESVVLALLGGLFGLALAATAVSLLKATLPADTPRMAEVHLDWRVIAFTGGLAVLTGLIFGLAPALQLARSALAESLGSSGRGVAVSISQRLRSSLAVAEVAFAVLLVISAGLLIRSFWALSHVNPGFQAEQILTARITPDENFCDDTARCLGFYRSVLDRARTAPGVSGAALVNTLPLGGRVTKRSLDIEDFMNLPVGTTLFWLDVVTPDYFRVMGIPLVAGRWFTQADESGGPPVVVLTEETARHFWKSHDVVGKHIRFAGEKDWRTVVGVVADVRAYDLQNSVPDSMTGTVYAPYTAQATLEDGRVPAEMTIAVRIAADRPEAATMLRQIMNGLDPDVPVSEVRSMRAVVSEAASTPASTTFLFATFAGIALVLGMVGIYGVLAFLVSKRAREMGIRMALGAQRSDVLWLVMKEGVKFAVSGIGLGLAGAFVMTRLLASQLYGVGPADPITFGGVTAVMAMVTLAACYIPARRAMRVDPMVALRYE